MKEKGAYAKLTRLTGFDRQSLYDWIGGTYYTLTGTYPRILLYMPRYSLSDHNEATRTSQAGDPKWNPLHDLHGSGALYAK